MNHPNPPSIFIEALNSLRNVDVDAALSMFEVASPTQLAPWSAAIEIATNKTCVGKPIGSATFVVLYDKQQTDNWGSPIRIVGHARIQIDTDQSTDPLLGEAVWNTIADNLDANGAGYKRMVGTVTRELSETFGGLELTGSTLNADIRCSWSPNSHYLGEHLMGWSEALRQNCGIEPAPVTMIGCF